MQLANTTPYPDAAAPSRSLSQVLSTAESIVLRYGLALVLGWIGAMKFTSYEANGIRPLEANSPLFSPILNALGTQPMSNLLGVMEISTALLLIAGAFAPRLGLLGSLLAIGTFLSTLTFLFSTPGWEPSLGGFPAISAGVGQFLLKDVVLLGAALFTARESLAALGANARS